MFHAIVLVMTFLGPQTVSDDGYREPKELVVRQFQPLTECDKKRDTALDDCILRLQKTGLKECRDFLKDEKKAKEGFVYNDKKRPYRYDCLLVNMD